MKNRCRFALAVSVAAVTLLIPVAHAQIGLQTDTFSYTDAEGTGSLTLVPLDRLAASDDKDPHRAQFTLVKQNGARLQGSGIYQYQPPGPFHLLAFAVVDEQGRGYFYRVTTFAGTNGEGGRGEYFPITSPQSVRQWQLSTRSTPGPTPGPEPTPNASRQPTDRAIELINQARQASHAEALQRVPALDAVADLYARKMAAGNAVGSDLFQQLRGQGYIPRAWGMASAWGSSSPEVIVALWTGRADINSTLARASFKECGIAGFQGYWCIVLGSR
jgi:uncharacterized protein YkwD